MADILAKLKQRQSEKIVLHGVTIEVRGLSIGELMEVSKPKAGEKARDNQSLMADLIVLCCFVGGKPLVADVSEVWQFTPEVFKALNDAVTNVNGGASGNSKATGSGASPSD
jgi:hypothetical protein